MEPAPAQVLTPIVDESGMNNTQHAARRSARGFTLVEMLVTLAIIVIVSSVALPSYLSNVRKGRRSDAMDAANAVLQAQERWRANNATYTTSFTDLKVNSASTGGYYTAAVSTATATGYTLTLAPVAGKGQSSDTGCTSMSVAVTNGQPTYSPPDCWSR
jgi:type IV pilus assembly protein PilE